MINNNIKILTGKGGKYQLPANMYDYMCLTSDRKLYINHAYSTKAEVLNKIAYFKEAKLFDDKPILLSSNEIRAFYDLDTKNTQDTSQLQREAIDLFKVAASRNASDVHIIVRKTESVIKMRITGDLIYYQEGFTAAHGNALCKTIFMTMCDQAGKTFQAKSRQDARMKSIYLPDGITGVRIGTSPTDSGYIFVCRLLKKYDSTKLNLDLLGYEDFQRELFNQAKSKKAGINIFSGPTGSGKSTTMAIIVGVIISESAGSKHVLTAENPVEYEIGSTVSITSQKDGKSFTKQIMSYATQTPIMGSNTRQTKDIFGDAIRSMMRLDPDVIMIGEIRDSGSLKAALDSSMTGHQVWTSVHATTAVGIITRVNMLGMEDNIQKELICDANNISSLISQRLVKKVCPHCSELLINHRHKVDKSLLERLTKALNNCIHKVRLRNSNGCNKCDGGSIGRTVVAEIVLTDQKFMSLMINSVYEAENYWLSKLNGVSMMMHGLLKVSRGEIDPTDLEDELEYINLPEGVNMDYFKSLLK